MATVKIKGIAVDLTTFRSQLDVLAAEYEALKAENDHLRHCLPGNGQVKKRDQRDEDVAIASLAPSSARSVFKVNEVWVAHGDKEQAEASFGVEHVNIELRNAPQMAPGKPRVQAVSALEDDHTGETVATPAAIPPLGASSSPWVGTTSGTSVGSFPTWMGTSSGKSTKSARINMLDSLSMGSTPCPCLDKAQCAVQETPREHTGRTSLISLETEGSNPQLPQRIGRMGSIRSMMSESSAKKRLSYGSMASSVSGMQFKGKSSMQSLGSKAVASMRSIQMLGSLSISEWGQTCIKEEEHNMAFLSGQGRTGLIPIWYDPEHAGEEAEQSLDFRVTQLIENPLVTLWICRNCVLSPVSGPRVAWDIMAFCFLMYEVWMIPFRIVFLPDQDESAVFQAINFVILTFFTIDIFVNFSTGFIHKDYIEYSRWPIAKRYLSSWFWVDLVATVPWDMALWSAGGGQTLRFSKIHKVLKTLRFLKMLRSIRMVHQLRKGRHPAEVKGVFVRGLQFLLVLCCCSHIYGCIYSVLQTDREAASELSMALEAYYRSFHWAFTALTCGSLGIDEGAGSPGYWTLEIAISVQRMVMAIAIMVSVIQYMPFLEEEANMNRIKADTIQYLQRHKLSMNTQIQLVYSLNETSKARRMQKHFDLMQTGLPMEVRRSICSEMWCPRLLSLGLIAEVSRWHRSFSVELAMVVHEDVLASKTILFKEGDAALAAYCILQGCFAIVSSLQNNINDFVDGMWLGEKSLVNPMLRRSATVVTREMSMVMSVPGQKFHDLLEVLGLKDEYRNFCRTKLWHGLCGRCGSMGDHFTDACPVIFSRKTWKDTAQAISGILGSRRSTAVVTSNVTQLSRGLQELLKIHELQWLADHLKALNVLDLEQLEHLDMDVLKEEIGQDSNTLSRQQELAISADSIRRFRELWIRETAAMLVHHIGPDQHLIFLSHYKMEAGTEAALMRTELDFLIKEDAVCMARNFEVPVFLDSEDLFTLERIQTRVRSSHNLALLLTENVLTRPWVLVEIVTAVVAGVIVLPVQLVRGFSEFQFPDEAFYKRVVKGDFLDQDGLDLLRDCHIELSQVEWALRDVFKRIAVPYSPHRPESIRKPELQALLKQCRLRQTIVSKDEDDGTTPIMAQKRTQIGHSTSDGDSYQSDGRF